MKIYFNAILRTAATILLYFLSFSSIAAPTQVDNFQANGAYSAADFYDQNLGSNVFIYVSQNNSKGPNNTQSYLNFYTYNCTWGETSYSCTYLFGFGLIPENDYKIIGNGSQTTLNFDTNTPGFYYYGYTSGCDWYTNTCTYDPFTPSSSVISLKWQKDYGASSTTKGVQTFKAGIYSMNTNGETTSNTAELDGTFLGSSITGSGSIGTNRNTSVSIFKNQ